MIPNQLRRREVSIPVTISGVSAAGLPEWVSADVFGSTLARGRVTGITVRNNVGSVATAIDLYAVHSGDALAAVPRDDLVAARALALTLLPTSATASTTNTDFATPRQFAGGLRVGGLCSFSGAGAYSFQVTVRAEVES